MKCRIVIFCRAQIVADFDNGVQFFFYFSCKSLLGRFTFFDFAAGKFPPTFPIAIASLGSENRVTAHDDRTDNIYLLQTQVKLASLVDRTFILGRFYRIDSAVPFPATNPNGHRIEIR